MTIPLNTLGLSGTILLWLGVILAVGGLALFLAVCGGISPVGNEETLHSHDTYYILIHGSRRLIFLLPLVAGLILIASGLLIRRQLPILEAMVMNLAEQDPASGPP
jgi:hypothetical protein